MSLCISSWYTILSTPHQDSLNSLQSRIPQQFVTKSDHAHPLIVMLMPNARKKDTLLIASK